MQPISTSKLLRKVFDLNRILFVFVYLVDVYLRKTRKTRTVYPMGQGGTPLDQERLERMGIQVPNYTKRGPSLVAQRYPYDGSRAERQPLLNTRYSQL